MTNAHASTGNYQLHHPTPTRASHTEVFSKVSLSKGEAAALVLVYDAKGVYFWVIRFMSVVAGNLSSCRFGWIAKRWWIWLAPKLKTISISDCRIENIARNRDVPHTSVGCFHSHMTRQLRSSQGYHFTRYSIVYFATDLDPRSTPTANLSLVVGSILSLQGQV